VRGSAKRKHPLRKSLRRVFAHQKPSAYFLRIEKILLPKKKHFPRYLGRHKDFFPGKRGPISNPILHKEQKWGSYVGQWGRESASLTWVLPGEKRELPLGRKTGGCGERKGYSQRVSIFFQGSFSSREEGFPFKLSRYLVLQRRRGKGHSAGLQRIITTRGGQNLLYRGGPRIGSTGRKKQIFVQQERAAYQTKSGKEPPRGGTSLRAHDAAGGRRLSLRGKKKRACRHRDEMFGYPDQEGLRGGGREGGATFRQRKDKKLFPRKFPRWDQGYIWPEKASVPRVPLGNPVREGATGRPSLRRHEEIGHVPINRKNGLSERGSNWAQRGPPRRKGGERNDLRPNRSCWRNKSPNTKEGKGTCTKVSASARGQGEKKAPIDRGKPFLARG